MSEAYDNFKRGLWVGTSNTYQTIASWIEEDLAEGRPFDNYPEVLRRNAAKLEFEIAEMDAAIEPSKSNLDAVAKTFQKFASEHGQELASYIGEKE